MKYFRTKDGRIIPFLDEDRETKLPTRDLRFYYIQPDNAITFIDKDEIIKQANTIEELGDEIIFILEGASIPYSAPYQYDRERQMEWFKIETEIDIGFGFMKKIKEKFLAIWIKGIEDEPILKPVAKMKGILPNGEIDWELL